MKNSFLRSTTIGIDEAGRGALAGPVYAACVLLNDGFDISILNDSKKLTAQKREETGKIIRSSCIYGIGTATHKEIDSANILKATFLAMQRAFENFLKMTEKKGLVLKNAEIIVDGNLMPDFLKKYESNLFAENNSPFTAQTLVKADAKIPAVMAASILAKTERDRIMCLADEKWPQYGYRKHKGYGTAAHMAAIKKFGQSPIQRLTFQFTKP